MQKPEKMTVREFVSQKVSQELQFDQEIVDTVISWSYKKANEASKSHKEVEISGIGKLMLSQAKLKKAIEKCERMIPHLEGDKLQFVIQNLETLKACLRN